MFTTHQELLLTFHKLQTKSNLQSNIFDEILTQSPKSVHFIAKLQTKSFPRSEADSRLHKF